MNVEKLFNIIAEKFINYGLVWVVGRFYNDETKKATMVSIPLSRINYIQTKILLEENVIGKTNPFYGYIFYYYKIDIPKYDPSCNYKEMCSSKNSKENIEETKCNSNETST